MVAYINITGIRDCQSLNEYGQFVDGELEYWCIVVSATRLVSCEKCERVYIVSNEGESQPHKIPAVDDLAADRQPFPKYKQPPVPTKVTLSDAAEHL